MTGINSINRSRARRINRFPKRKNLAEKPVRPSPANKFNLKVILRIVFCSFETGLGGKKAVVGSGLTSILS